MVTIFLALLNCLTNKVCFCIIYNYLLIIILLCGFMFIISLSLGMGVSLNYAILQRTCYLSFGSFQICQSKSILLQALLHDLSELIKNGDRFIFDLQNPLKANIIHRYSCKWSIWVFYSEVSYLIKMNFS